MRMCLNHSLSNFFHFTTISFFLDPTVSIPSFLDSPLSISFSLNSTLTVSFSLDPTVSLNRYNSITYFYIYLSIFFSPDSTLFLPFHHNRCLWLRKYLSLSLTFSSFLSGPLSFPSHVVFFLSFYFLIRVISLSWLQVFQKCCLVNESREISSGNLLTVNNQILSWNIICNV